MTKLNNPFTGVKDYNCFGCAPDNEHGLRMEFFEDGDDVVSLWDAPDYFQGYNYILHGGVRASLIDELAAWVVFIKLKTAGYTTRLDVNYSGPVYTNRGRVELRGRLKEMKKNIAVVEVEILDEKGKIVTTGTAEYFTIPERIAAKKMMYPGIDAFYPASGN
ncbi:MAG: PaaI family thioesterase [Spirochaetales bacterium]|uniref:PaaI family thioesterase n=1 Tax=Candidatus Thalassospirochaeta sargassi TaxID=3119039 RepID=A0AAJ1MHZ0_9SPIO|nr:PaaI family thioesterase [Spirochaetales bacterium]